MKTTERIYNCKLKLYLLKKFSVSEIIFKVLEVPNQK